MAYITAQDALLEISAGNVSGRSVIEKFGRSDNVDNGIPGDVWDRGQTGTVWIAPTQARKHLIYASNLNDKSVGSGAKTIKIYGLPGWATSEINEDLTLNGTNAVTTVNSYVIIHRMKVLTKGGSPPNIGRISAVAQTDGTTTAIILAGQGQTQMVVYGIPSVQNLFLTRVYSNLIAAKTGSEVKLRLLVNPEPETELLGFVAKHIWGIRAAGNSTDDPEFRTFKKIPGPAIIKIEATGDVNDMDVDAGFEGVLIDN